jgi:biotin carboxyl carrier protein
MRYVLAVILIAGLLVGCDNSSTPQVLTAATPTTDPTGTPNSDPTPDPTATPTPAPTAIPTPDPTATPTPQASVRPASATTVSSSNASFGVLGSLPVEVSAVLAAGPLVDNSRTFIGFGMPKSGSPGEVSPQWEFAVPPGTPALAPVTGTVVAIETLWSNDFTVWISADGNTLWVWELEHVVDVQIKVGDSVEAGQPIATASVFGGRNTALVELGLLKGGQTPTHYCPLLYVDKSSASTIDADLAAIRKENLERLSRHGLVSDPEHDPDGQACWTELPVHEGS